MKTHPAADLFPMMGKEELERLAADIKENGLAESIVLDFSGEFIVDGRNRYFACQMAGVEPTFRNLPEDDDLIKAAASLNLVRRMLDTSQRAVIAARIMELYEDDAKMRRFMGLKMRWGTPKVTDEAFIEEKATSANLREPEKGACSALAAAALNVSTRSVETASKVIKEAAPEIIERVESGDLAVSSAVKVTGLPKDEQRELASLPLKELKAKIRAMDPRPTPAKARQEAIKRGVPVEANTGIMILPMPKAQEDALGEAMHETRTFYNAVRVIADYGRTPEYLIEQAAKWACSEMNSAAIKACDNLDRIIASYARPGQATSTGD